MSRGLLLGSLLLPVYLCACASAALEAPPPAVGDQPALEPASMDAARPPSPPLRDASGGLDADLVEEWTFAILVGEFAGHRGELDVASHYYLQAARLTGDAEVIERAVRVALAAQVYPDAVTAARLLTRVQPHRADAFRLLAVALLRDGRAEQAVKALDKVIALDPGNTTESFAVAAALLSGEEGREQAWAAMQALVRHHQQDPEAHLALARLATRWQRFDDALAAIGDALQRQPNWDEAQLLRAQVLLLKGDQDASAVALAEGVAAHPDSAKLRRFYAQLLLERKDFAAALEQFRALVAAEPDDGELLTTLGALYLQQENAGEARALFNRLLALDDYRSQAHYYLGQVDEVEKQLEQALAHYKEVEQGDDYLDAQVRRAVVLADLGRLDQAIRVLDRIDPEDRGEAVRIALVRGELQRDAKHYRQAYDAYSEALVELPNNVELLYARAMVAERLDRIDWLEADLRNVLEIDPDHVQALNALGYTLADRTDRYEEALEYIRRALAKQPEDYYILDSMGWVQFRLGNIDSALKYLTQAYETRRDIDIAAHLGEVLWVDGRAEEAERIWRQGLELDGDTSLIRETMERLQGEPDAEP